MELKLTMFDDVIGLTLVNNDNEIVSSVGGFVTMEPLHELLLLVSDEDESEEKYEHVRVLTITGLYTVPAYRGHKYGWGLLYKLAAQEPQVEYIVLDDTTGVSAAQGNLYYRMGFQHRQKDPDTNKEYWTTWYPEQPTIGPERLIHINALFSRPY
jgi:GNAT superfamily N-acetyltransferase